MKQKIEEMKRGIEQQRIDRERQVQREIQDNLEYMKKVMEHAEQEKKRQEEKDKRHRDTVRDN